MLLNLLVNFYKLQLKLIRLTFKLLNFILWIYLLIVTNNKLKFKFSHS